MNFQRRNYNIVIFYFLIALADFTIAPQESVSKATHIRIVLYAQRLAFQQPDRLGADRGPNSVCQRLAEALHVRIVFSFHHDSCERLCA